MVDQLSPQDAQFLYMEDADVVASVTAIQICDQSTAPGGKVRFKDIISKIQDRLHHTAMYNHHLMRLPMDLDFPYWVEDPHFDIENHIRHARLPEPSDWRQFCIHMARYHSRPLDMGRPLWEAYVVEGLDNLEGYPEKCFALVLKLHHAAVDGTSAAQFLGNLWDISPEGVPAMPAEYNRDPATHAPTLPGTLMRAAYNNVRSPLRLSQAVMRASPQISRALINASRSGFGRSKSGVPNTVFNSRVSHQKAFDATKFSLADFKVIRTAYPEAKVNDIVLAICSGGLRQYLTSKNGLPDTSLIATAPVNTRPKDVTLSAEENAGNQISAMTVPLHTNIPHPVERLKAIVLATRKTKEAKDGLAARLMTDLTQHVPAATMALASRIIIQNTNTAQSISNCTISNVPGPQLPLYFCGAKLVGGYGMAPLAHGMGLFIATPSYNGEISFSVTSTREILPDISFFIQCLENSFKELMTAAEARLAADEKPKRPKKLKKRKSRVTRVSRKTNGASRPTA